MWKFRLNLINLFPCEFMQPTNALYDKIRLQKGFCTTQKRVICCKPFYGMTVTVVTFPLLSSVELVQISFWRTPAPFVYQNVKAKLKTPSRRENQQFGRKITAKVHAGLSNTTICLHVHLLSFLGATSKDTGEGS